MPRSYMKPSQVLLLLLHPLSPSKLACPFPIPAQTLSQVTSGTNAHPMLSTALLATNAPMADVNSSLSFSRAADVLTTVLVTGLLRLVLLEAAVKVPSLFQFQSPVEMEGVEAAEVAAAAEVMGVMEGTEGAEGTEGTEALLETEAMVVAAAAGALEALEAPPAVAETEATAGMEVTAVDLADPVAVTGITEINLLSSSTQPSRLGVKAASWLSL